MIKSRMVLKRCRPGLRLSRCVVRKISQENHRLYRAPSRECVPARKDFDKHRAGSAEPSSALLTGELQPAALNGSEVFSHLIYEDICAGVQHAVPSSCQGLVCQKVFEPAVCIHARV